MCCCWLKTSLLHSIVEGEQWLLLLFHIWKPHSNSFHWWTVTRDSSSHCNVEKDTGGEKWALSSQQVIWYNVHCPFLYWCLPLLSYWFRTLYIWWWPQQHVLQITCCITDPTWLAVRDLVLLIHLCAHAHFPQGAPNEWCCRAEVQGGLVRTRLRISGMGGFLSRTAHQLEKLSYNCNSQTPSQSSFPSSLLQEVLTWNLVWRLSSNSFFLHKNSLSIFYMINHVLVSASWRTKINTYIKDANPLWYLSFLPITDI